MLSSLPVASSSGVLPLGTNVAASNGVISAIGTASAITSWGSVPSNCTRVIRVSWPSDCCSASRVLKPPMTSSAIAAMEPDRSNSTYRCTSGVGWSGPGVLGVVCSDTVGVLSSGFVRAGDPPGSRDESGARQM